MARNKSAIIKSIQSFAGSAAKQWDTCAKLAYEVTGHYWEHGDSSLIVELDKVLPEVNRNMEKAFRKVVAECTPVTLKADREDGAHGASSKNKRKALVKANDYADRLATLITETSKGQVGVGDNLKAFLPAKKQQDKKSKSHAAKVAIALNTAKALLESDDFAGSNEEIATAKALMEQVAKMAREKMISDLGLDNGISEAQEQAA